MSRGEIRHNLITPLFIFLITALLLLSVLVGTTAYLYQDRRGIWYMGSLGLEVIYLPDPAGLVIWLYAGDDLVFNSRLVRPALPTPYPISIPYPTTTPYPMPRPTIPLQGA